MKKEIKNTYKIVRVFFLLLPTLKLNLEHTASILNPVGAFFMSTIETVWLQVVDSEYNTERCFIENLSPF